MRVRNIRWVGVPAQDYDGMVAFVRDSRWEWIHFRAPDGHLYELASRLDPGRAD